MENADRASINPADRSDGGWRIDGERPMKYVWIPTIVTLTLAAFLALIVHVSIVPSIFPMSNAIDIMLVLSVFLSILFRYEWGLIAALVGGFLIDTVTITPLRETISLLVALVITNVLFRLFFTNKSLWTLILLGGIATMIARLVQSVLLFSFDNFMHTTVTHLIAHTILFSMLYFCTWTLGTRLKSYILVRRT